MAQDPSGPGGSTTYSPYSGIGGVQTFDIEAWRRQQEEEKKRKAAAALRAEEQNILRKERQQRYDLRPNTANINADSGLFRARAQEVKQQTALEAQGEKKQDDAMKRYWGIVRRDGQEKVATRLAAITSAWNTRNSPYSGGEVIYDMLLSPYSVEEIDTMFEGAHNVLFESGRGRLFRQEDINDFRVDLRNKYNVSSYLWDSLEDVFVAQEKAEIPTDPVTGFLLLSLLIPGVGEAGLAARAGMFGLRAVQTMAVASTAVGALAEQQEMSRAATMEEKMAAAEKQLTWAGSPFAAGLADMGKGFGYGQPIVAEGPLQEVTQIRQFMNTMNKAPDSREDIKAIQAQFHGQGVGTDLPISGIFDYEWQAAIVDAAEETTRLVYDQQRKAVEAGSAPYWAPINGDPYWSSDGSGAIKIDAARGKGKMGVQGITELDSDVEGWPQWLAKYEALLTEREQRREANPDRYAFWENSGIPTTKLELEAFGNRLGKMGWLQALYKTPLEGALLFGKTWQATGSAINLWSRQRADPNYLARQQDLFDYVAAQDFEPLPEPYTYWEKKPEDMTEAFARVVISFGYLKDDPKAQQLLAAVDQRQTELIQERYAPDYLLTMGYFAGADYNEVKDFGLENPDITRAFTVGLDALMAYANPIGRAYRMTAKPNVKPTLKAWKKSGRAYTEAKRATDALLDWNMGRAARQMNGTAAKPVLQSLYNITGKKAHRLDPKSKIVQDLAHDVAQAIDDGVPERTARILEGAPDPFINELVSITNTRPGLSRTQVRGLLGSQLERSLFENKLAARIAARQSKYGDAISKDVLLKRMDDALGQEYAYGAAIFPHLRDNRLSAPGRTFEWMQTEIGKVGNDWVREFMTKTFITPFRRAPTSEIDYQGLSTLESVNNAALTISQDAAWASNFRNRWAAARSVHQFGRLISELDAMYTKKYKTKTTGPMSIMQQGADILGAEKQALAPRPEVTWVDAAGRTQRFAPKHPEFLTEFLSKDVEGNLIYKQAVPDTVYQMYTAAMHRGALWAPYNTSHASALGAAYLTGVNLFYRYPIGAFHAVSTPLRQWTVAMGAPLLFQKHALTDTFRTTVEEGPFSIMEAFGLRGLTVKGKTMVPRIRSVLARRLEKTLSELPPDVVNYVQYVKAKAHSSEAQWLAPGRTITFKANTIWNEQGKLVNLNASADALVRMTRGEGFKRWSAGSMNEVVAEGPAYYYSPVTNASVKTWYHGTGGRVESLADYDLFAHSQGVYNAYGPGLYLTDNPRIAGLYAGKVKNRGDKQGARTFEVKVSADRVLDLELPAPPEVIAVIRKAIDDADYMDWAESLESVKAIEAGAPLKEVYAGLREDMKGSSLPRYELDEFLSGVNEAIANLGYDAFSHTGGVASGRAPHNVLVLLQPKGEFGGPASLAEASPWAGPTRTVSHSGEQAVRDWLGTTEGKQFLSDGGWFELHKNLQKELDLGGGRKLTQRQAQANVVEEFIDTIVRREWERLETALPDIMPTLKQMALNDQVINMNGVKRLIADNPTNNAVLSEPYPAGLRANGLAGYVVGKAMYMNKWNRDTMFDSVFTRQYTKLRKQGMEARQAGEVAADLAEMNVARVHFDLSYALGIEAKHRWLAWFATKHRLYGTYMVKLAAQRPMLAGIIPEIMDWMQERNEKKGADEFDKYDLILDVGEGKQVRINLAPYMWFSDFPLESSFALALERGFEYSVEGLGGELPEWVKPSPAPFGLTLTRADALFFTVRDIMKSEGVSDNESLQKFLNALPEDRRNRWRRLINNQRALAAAEGKNITPVQAFNKAKGAAWQTQAWQTFKFYSGRMMDERELEIEKLLREFSNMTDDDAAKEMLRTNPVLAAALNASMDPVEKAQLDEGFRQYYQYLDLYQAVSEQASDRGTLAAEWRKISSDFKAGIERMTNPIYVDSYNPTFAKYFGDHNPQEFIESLGLLLPLMPADDVWATGRAKLDTETQDHKENILTPVFEERLKDFGLTDKDTSVLLYQLMEEEYIVKPLAEWTGENPYILAPYAAQTQARYLARSGETGVYKADNFLDMVENQTFRQWIGAGISDGKASVNEPFMAYFSPLKKDLVGWNSDPALEQAWIEWAKYDWALDKWARETQVTDEKGTHGISKSSTLYKNKREEVMGPVLAGLSSIPGFANEYAFSMLPLHERLRAFGVGTGSTEEDKGMDQFLGIVERMWDELDRADNPNSKEPGVTPGAQAGSPIVLRYSQEVAQLAKANERWWNMFRGTYPLSKFGFSTTWRLSAEQYPEYQFIYWDSYPEEGGE